MRWSLLYTLTLIAASVLSGCATTDAFQHSDRLAMATVEEASGRTATVSDAVTVRCTNRDGIIDVVLTCDGRPFHLTVERDATIYCLPRSPRVVLLHERHASNDDRLVICDLQGGSVQSATVELGDTEAYTHTHYAIKGARDGQVLIEEVQYAGDAPARARDLALPMRLPARPVVGEWRASPAQ